MTAIVVWPFPFLRPYRELPITEETVIGLGHGVFLYRDDLPDPGFMLQLRGSVRINGATVLLKTWQDWIDTYGTTSSFLVKATDVVARSTSNYSTYREVVTEAVGTGDGAETVFTLDKRHIDASTLAVYVDGVLQTGGGTDYTLSGNDTTPTITFVVAPPNLDAVTADYEYYWPVRIASWAEQEHRNGPVIRFDVVLIEEQAGQHLAA